MTDDRGYPSWEYPTAPRDVPPPPPADVLGPRPDGSPEAPAETLPVSPVEGFSAGAPPKPRRGVLRYGVVAAAAAFVVVASFVGMKLFALRGSGDVLTRMAPSDSDAYVTVYLDPSLGQKAALRSLVGKFPAADGVQGLQDSVDRALDQLLAPAGVRYAADVKPWVGSQVAVVVRWEGTTAHLAILVASSDDGAARAALARAEATDRRRGPTRTENHGGVPVFVCTCPEGTADALAFVDHTAILGDDPGLVMSIVDTAGGDRSLASAQAFVQATADLPKDRLVLAYVDAGSVLGRLRSSLGGTAGLQGGGFFAGSSSTLDAYRGVGMALSAHADGVGLDVTVTTDPSRLTAEQRAALEQNGHLNTTLQWTPERAYAVFAATNADTEATAFVDQVTSADPTAAGALAEYGLTGPDGVLTHLTGDVALEAAPGLGPIPDVAVLVGTDDAVAVRRSLDVLGRKATDALTATLPGGADPRDLPPPAWRTTTYMDPSGTAVPISWLAVAQLGSMGVEPAYATVDGMTIVGSSRHAVSAALDAHGGKGDITDASEFQAALSHGEAAAGSLEYVDVGAVVSAVRDALPMEARQPFMVNVEPNLRPVRSLIVTGTTTPDRTTVRLFLTIR